ncbi:Tn3 family transposase [Actinomadura roseirufa]|uniref:Tn3 family transposase n=1 Tax=Actinomadura roseirufa TaxID=2094049 RepID=UPI0010419AA5
MLRVAGSLTTGQVRACDLIRMLSRDGRPTGLGDAFAHYPPPPGSPDRLRPARAAASALPRGRSSAATLSPAPTSKPARVPSTPPPPMTRLRNISARSRVAVCRFDR